MKILLLADEESKYLWDYFDKSKVEGIDLIISCGDLSPQYLSFLATFSHAPVLYVHGNHDVCYKDTPPGGCEFGGADHQYSERAMARRVRKLRFKIMRNKGFDILVAHSPAYRINDSEDLPHTGFKCFRTLMEEYRPKYFVHGHVHINYGRDFVRESKYEDTTIINAYERYIIEI